MKKSLWTCIFGSLLCVVVVASTINHTNNVTTEMDVKQTKEENQDYLKGCVMETKCLQSTYSTFINNYDLKTNEIKFANQLKKIYLSHSDRLINPQTQLRSQQITKYDDVKTNYGYFELTSLAQVEVDMKTRIQDWIKCYSNSLHLGANTDINWGISIPTLSLDNSNIWQQNTQARSITSPIAYANSDGAQAIFDNAGECTFHCYGEAGMKNTKTNITGIPFTYLKDTSTHLSVLKVPVAIAYFLSASGTVNEKTRNLEITNTCEPLVGKYNIDNLLSIQGGSYQNKTIRLGINQEFVNASNELEEYHALVKNKIIDKWNTATANLKSCDAQTLQELIDTNFLDDDNVDNFIKRCQSYKSDFNFIDAYVWLKANRSTKESEYVKTLGLNENDNPKIMLNDLQDKLNFNISYAISSQQQPDQWQPNVMHMTYQGLLNGVEIPLTPNQQNQYQFRLDCITANEVNTDDVYVENQSTDKIYLSSNNIVNETKNIYSLTKSCVNDIRFNGNDASYNEHYFPSDLTDEKIFTKYVNLVTNYQELGDLSLLDKSQYSIERDEVNGTIKITIRINEHTFSNTFVGFKKAEKELPDIDGSIDTYNLICNDLDNLEIHKLLALNKIDPYIVCKLECKVIDEDEINGIATIQIVNCDDESLKSIYDKQIFHINKLAPYYIRQKQNIDKTILQKKPSEITTSDCVSSLLDMSDEFKNRNLNNLRITTIPHDSDHSLTVSVSYTEDNKIVSQDFTFNKFSTMQDNTTFILWIVIGIFSAIAIGLVSFVLWKKFHKRRLDNPTK